MSDRTFGETTNCTGCRFWSEMIAQSIGGGPIEALCLAEDGPMRGKYTTARMTCAAWKAGYLGAIDDPPGGLFEAYEIEDGEDAAF